MMKHVLKLTLAYLWLAPGASAVAEAAVQSKHLAVAFSRDVPAAVGAYTIRPLGGEGERCGTIKAFVRTKV